MATRKFTKRPVQASAGRTVTASQDFWSTDVNSIHEIQDEIQRAIDAGTTFDDVDDYLNELYELGIIDDEELNELISWSNGLLSNPV